jgi:Sec-independent protein translocase protein TatA
MIIIFFVALIFVGPEKLPSMGRELGKFVRSLNSTLNEFKEEIGNEKDSSTPLIEEKQDD